MSTIQGLIHSLLAQNMKVPGSFVKSPSVTSTSHVEIQPYSLQLGVQNQSTLVIPKLIFLDLTVIIYLVGPINPNFFVLQFNT